MYNRILVLVVLFIAPQLAYATNYYINPELGRDSWAGNLAVPADTNGPWQTLNRLATASLLPGDAVYLACGATWNETLRIKGSGTPEAPIVISGGPGACDVPPAIDGAVAIPGHMWKQHSGSIYRARLPIEYISNPSLSTDTDGWKFWAPRNDASMSLDSACSESPLPCMEFVSGTGAGNSVATSNNFPIVAGVDYSAKAQVKAPAGVPVKFVIRRGGPSFESFTADQVVPGSGSWQTVRFAFRATRTAPNARFDIEVPGGQIKINVREVHMQRVLALDNLIGAFVDDFGIRPAHHPNFGQVSTNPDSPFAQIAAAGGKTIVDTDGLPLPPHASLTPGLGISIRTRPWTMEERKVASISGTRLILDRTTFDPIQRGYGYFLTGALWMLDSPGEWYFDASKGDLYVWMPDGAEPGNRVSFSSLLTGVNLRGKGYIELTGFQISHVGTGALLGAASTNNIRLRNMTISEVADYGIEADGCQGCKVEHSTIARTGLDAVKALVSASGFSITDSLVTGSGALTRTDGWRKLPRPARAAINVGMNANISRNQIIDTANNGLFLGTKSTAEKNLVRRACLSFNDCAAIYGNFAGPNSSILGNVVDDVPGSLIGIPETLPNHVAGIYLDDGGAGFIVQENTVQGADYGIKVHNTIDSTLAENLIFGSRRFPLRMEEDTSIRRSSGDLHGNRVESNHFIPIASGPNVSLHSIIGDTDDFATFYGNRYSALISARVISEASPSGGASYTLAEWMAKGQDARARAKEPAGYASFLSAGANIIPNGSLSNGYTGWTWWSQVAPFPQGAVSDCSFGRCLQVTAGGSTSVFSSPNFSVTEGEWYRVTFDAAALQGNQAVTVRVRRSGGGPFAYEPLMPAGDSFLLSTDWRRYSFLFRALKTALANDPTIGNKGARVDFEIFQPGSSIHIARLEMVPLTLSQSAQQLRLQLNTSTDSAVVSCSSSDEDSGLCDKFAYMDDDSAVDWSSLIDPLSGKALYTRDMTLVDADGDGVADSQDTCTDTAPGAAVNASGCAFDQ